MQPENGEGTACAAARHEIASFVHPGLDGERARALRAHCVRCPDCAALYRSTLQQAARVGHELRTERVERERDQRHAELVRLSRGPSAQPSRLWLKLFLVTCGLLFLLSRLTHLGFGARLVAQEAVGRVDAAGAPLEPGASRVLARGDLCATGPGARVSLAFGGTQLALDADSALLVEEPGGAKGPRVRLLAGGLTAGGPCVVTTPFGVVTVTRGRCLVALVEDALWARCEEGSALVVGPLGPRALAAGQETRLALEG